MAEDCGEDPWNDPRFLADFYNRLIQVQPIDVFRRFALVRGLITIDGQRKLQPIDDIGRHNELLLQLGWPGRLASFRKLLQVLQDMGTTDATSLHAGLAELLPKNSGHTSGGMVPSSTTPDAVATSVSTGNSVSTVHNWPVATDQDTVTSVEQQSQNVACTDGISHAVDPVPAQNPWTHHGGVFLKHYEKLKLHMNGAAMRGACLVNGLITMEQDVDLADITRRTMHNEELLRILRCGDLRTFRIFRRILAENSNISFAECLKDFSRV